MLSAGSGLGPPGSESRHRQLFQSLLLTSHHGRCTTCGNGPGRWAQRAQTPGRSLGWRGLARKCPRRQGHGPGTHLVWAACARAPRWASGGAEPLCPREHRRVTQVPQLDPARIWSCPCCLVQALFPTTRGHAQAHTHTHTRLQVWAGDFGPATFPLPLR